MFEKLDGVVTKFHEITEKLGEAGLNHKEFQKLNKERVHLEPIVENYLKYKNNSEEIVDNKELLQDDDEEMRILAKEEITRMEKENIELEATLKILLLPKDPNDEKNVIMEIRAGTGGDEAALFVAELFKMYTSYASSMRWQIEIISISDGSKGGMKEAIFQISGDQVYSRMKYESGVHRVQRVPETETQGRVHTSACTVAVLPEAEDIELNIRDQDLRIDTMRAGGPGGQCVNTTDSAVRITHMPTGIVVQCQDQKSQLKNKAKAMIVLKARIFDKLQGEADAERAAERKGMVKTGDRSEKIRTYNFPQDRCTDHRVNVTVHNLPKLFSGEMEIILGQVLAKMQAELLREMEDTA